MKKITKDTIYSMRLTAEERRLLDEKAAIENISIAMFIRVHFINKVLRK